MSSARDELQAKATEMAMRINNAKAVKEERKRMASTKPESLVRRRWKASVKRVNDDISGRNLAKAPSPSPQKLARSKTISWGRFEKNDASLPAQPSLPNPPAKPKAAKTSAHAAKEFGRRHESLMKKLGLKRGDPRAAPSFSQSMK